MPVITTRPVKLASPDEMAKRIKKDLRGSSMLRKLAREDEVYADNRMWADLLEIFWNRGLVEKRVFDNRLSFILTTYGATVARKVEELNAG